MNQPADKALPELSSASVNEGMWYVFRDGGATIRAWGSNWTGFERVYFDEQMLERFSRTRRQQQYRFTQNGHKYKISCRTKNPQRWQVECQLWKDDYLVQVIRFKRRKLWNVRPTIAHLWVGVGTGLVGGLLKMPWWFGIVFIFAALTTMVLTTAKTADFTFELE